MTKRFQIHTIGTNCSKGPWCRLIGEYVFAKGVCHGEHTWEIADPEKKYTVTFETVRPEMFVEDK